VKIGFKFQSLGKISNISAADPPVLLGQFQHWCDATLPLVRRRSSRGVSMYGVPLVSASLPRERTAHHNWTFCCRWNKNGHPSDNTIDLQSEILKELYVCLSTFSYSVAPQ